MTERFQAYLSRNKNGNSGDMVFSNMGQFWWNGCIYSFLRLTEGKANRTTSSFDDRSTTLMTDSTFEVYQ